MSHMPIVVAIPVKNEEARIGACLDALARQTLPFDRLILFLNNCTDTTAEICARFRAQHAGVKIVHAKLRGDLACAGEARRLALHHAAAIAPESLILTTDADAVPARDWTLKNHRAIAAGAQVVCGMAKIDPMDAENLGAAFLFDEMRERFLLNLLDEITFLANPDPHDPWPRHQQQSGASIAMRRDIFQLAGGAPRVATGEDRALIARLRLVDARIRHAPEIAVCVSGRMQGRACGGMADTILRRHGRQDALTDAKLEPAIDALRRAVAQARLATARRGLESGARLAEDLLINPAEMTRIVALPFHGQAWARLEAASPVLHRRRVAFAGLDREIRIALALRDKLLNERNVKLRQRTGTRQDA